MARQDHPSKTGSKKQRPQDADPSAPRPNSAHTPDGTNGKHAAPQSHKANATENTPQPSASAKSRNSGGGKNREGSSEAQSRKPGEDAHTLHSRFESLLQDVRFALRTLRKSWGFGLTAILTLALGIGANTAIFQLVDAVRLRSLPVAHPERLAGVQVKNGNRGFGITVTDNETALTYPLWEQIRLHQQVFSNLFAWADSGSASLGEGAQMRRARGLWFSGDAFNTLGIYPFRGRFFSAQDDRMGCGTPGAVISYGLWQSEFAGQDAAIGSNIIVDGRPTEVIGVAPRSFFGLEVGYIFSLWGTRCFITLCAVVAPAGEKAGQRPVGLFKIRSVAGT